MLRSTKVLKRPLTEIKFVPFPFFTSLPFSDDTWWKDGQKFSVRVRCHVDIDWTIGVHQAHFAQKASHMWWVKGTKDTTSPSVQCSLRATPRERSRCTEASGYTHTHTHTHTPPSPPRPSQLPPPPTTTTTTHATSKMCEWVDHLVECVIESERLTIIVTWNNPVSSLKSLFVPHWLGNFEWRKTFFKWGSLPIVWRVEVNVRVRLYVRTRHNETNSLFCLFLHGTNVLTWKLFPLSPRAFHLSFEIIRTNQRKFFSKGSSTQLGEKWHRCSTKSFVTGRCFQNVRNVHMLSALALHLSTVKIFSAKYVIVFSLCLQVLAAMSPARNMKVRPRMPPWVFTHIFAERTVLFEIRSTDAGDPTTMQNHTVPRNMLQSGFCSVHGKGTDQVWPGKTLLWTHVVCRWKHLCALEWQSFYVHKQVLKKRQNARLPHKSLFTTGREGKLSWQVIMSCLLETVFTTCKNASYDFSAIKFVYDAHFHTSKMGRDWL